MLKFFVSLILVLTMNSVCAAKSAKPIEFKYEKKGIVLFGKLINDKSLTPDEVEVVFPEIVLNTAINVSDDSDPNAEEAEFNVSKIQLALNSELMKTFKKLKGKQVKLTGSLYHWQTGHHYTKVLIFVEEIKLANTK
ncbi:MAG: DUF4431 domain-containing protein [Pseudobdellovibrio sp.]